MSMYLNLVVTFGSLLLKDNVCYCDSGFQRFCYCVHQHDPHYRSMVSGGEGSETEEQEIDYFVGRVSH